LSRASKCVYQKRIWALREINILMWKKSTDAKIMLLAVTRGNSYCHDVGREEKIIVPFIFVYWGSRFHSKPFDPLKSTICSFRHHDANFIFVFWPGIKTILKSFRFQRYFSVFFYACDLDEILKKIEIVRFVDRYCYSFRWN